VNDSFFVTQNHLHTSVLLLLHQGEFVVEFLSATEQGPDVCACVVSIYLRTS